MYVCIYLLHDSRSDPNYPYTFRIWLAHIPGVCPDVTYIVIAKATYTYTSYENQVHI